MLALEHLRRQLHEKGSLLIAVKVVPRAAKSEITECAEDGAWKVRLAAAPEKGKANEELRKLLAECFEVSKSQVALVSERLRHTSASGSLAIGSLAAKRAVDRYFG